jgi:small subunit ribosomal protein S6
MRPYEVMVIFDADLDEETIRSAVTRYTQLIEGRGAQPGPVDFWGKRRFAYELKHRWEGYYVVLQAKAEPPAMDELHRVLSLADEVLRHKILRIPDAVYGKLAGTRPAPVPEAVAPDSGAGPAPEEAAESSAATEAEAAEGVEADEAEPTGAEAPAGVDGGGA